MFYKYRSLSQNGFFKCIDIIIKKRLYASRYIDLNDPMEGFYLCPKGKLSEKMQYSLQKKIDAVRIVSLSKRNDKTLMWSHYADGHKGIVIGIEINENQFDVRPVIYGELPTIKEEDIGEDTYKELLSTKLSPWFYEEEVRILAKRRYIPVEIKEIIYGTKINQTVRSVLRRTVNTIDPAIEIRRVTNLE